jgi:hypothetical protein
MIKASVKFRYDAKQNVTHLYLIVHDETVAHYVTNGQVSERTAKGMVDEFINELACSGYLAELS